MSGTESKTIRIDMHHHALFAEYLDVVKKHGTKDGGGVAFHEWNPKKNIELMDRRGISAAVLGMSSPGIYFGDVSETRKLARRYNEWLAEVVRDHPTRFGALAALPIPDIDASLEELAYALDVLKLDGVGALTSF